MDEDLFYVYILTNKNHKVLYIGYSNNLKRQLKEHQSGNAKKSFTRRYNVYKLIYFEVFKYPMKAIKREKQIKKWNREWKTNLINDMNPDWEDWSWRLESLA